MKLMKITRANSLIVNLFYSLSFSSVIGYILMAAAWFISGMRLDLVQCSGLWIIFLVVLFIILGTICAVIDILKHIQLQKLAEHRLTKGYDDEYFDMLRRFIGGELTDSQQLYFASSYLEGERCEDCREQLKKLNFKALDSSEQEEYFNICLYSAILEGNKELANDIYAKARKYFDRAVMGRRCGYVLHTLGLLCYLNGRSDNAARLFESAMRSHDYSLRCECCLGLGRIYLDRGERSEAKDMCYEAAQLVETRSQAVHLKQLMMDVEKAYGKE